jgi:hypothetical protein
MFSSLLVNAPNYVLSLLSVFFLDIVMSIRAIVVGIRWLVGCAFLGM